MIQRVSSPLLDPSKASSTASDYLLIRLWRWFQEGNANGDDCWAVLGPPSDDDICSCISTLGSEGVDFSPAGLYFLQSCQGGTGVGPTKFQSCCLAITKNCFQDGIIPSPNLEFKGKESLGKLEDSTSIASYWHEGKRNHQTESAATVFCLHDASVHLQAKKGMDALQMPCPHFFQVFALDGLDVSVNDQCALVWRAYN